MACDPVKNSRRKRWEYDDNSEGWIEHYVGTSSIFGGVAANWYSWQINLDLDADWPAWFRTPKIMKKHFDELTGEKSYLYVTDDGQGSCELKVVARNKPEEVEPGIFATQVGTLIIQQKDQFGTLTFSVRGRSIRTYPSVRENWSFSEWFPDIGDIGNGGTINWLPLRRCHDCENEFPT